MSAGKPRSPGRRRPVYSLALQVQTLGAFQLDHLAPTVRQPCGTWPKLKLGPTAPFHKADDLRPGPGRLSGEPFQELLSIVVIVHDVLSDVAPRHDVIDGARERDTQSSWHRTKPPGRANKSGLFLLPPRITIRQTGQDLKGLLGKDGGIYNYTSECDTRVSQELCCSSIKGGDDTCCSASSPLPRHASPATAGCEALGTTYPHPQGWRPNASRGRDCQHRGGRGPGGAWYGQPR